MYTFQHGKTGLVSIIRDDGMVIEFHCDNLDKTRDEEIRACKLALMRLDEERGGPKYVAKTIDDLIPFSVA